jgi:predicted O-methyltransferase YrrM
MKLLPFEVERRLRGLKFRLSRKLPDRQPAAVWPGIDTTAVTLRPFAGQFGNLQRYELMVLCAVARHLGARQLFEFGTFDGLTTWHLAANVVPDARVWTLDLPLNHPARYYTGHDRTVGRIHAVRVGAMFTQTEEAGRIEQLYSDSLDFDAEAHRGRIDFCFIDASHEYQHVCRDTANALIMTRPGGVIFWHDYSRWWPGVQKCLDDLSVERPVFRVQDTALAALIVESR